jgi:predicted aspartyl protease
MISGIVTNGHATVTVAFRLSNRSNLPIEFVIYTGFTDYLMLGHEQRA